MTVSDIDTGRLIRMVGMAPVKPAEFVFIGMEQKTVAQSASAISTSEMTDEDPYTSFNFRVTIDGAVGASFAECSGLAVEVANIDHREGNENVGVRELPGLKKSANITLKRGAMADTDVQDRGPGLKATNNEIAIETPGKRREGLGAVDLVRPALLH